MPTREELRWKYFEESKTVRTVRKQAKRNRKPDETRRRDWNFDTDNLDAFYDLDVSAEERVMPRGERERRRTVLTNALAQPREPEPPLEEVPAAPAERAPPAGSLAHASWRGRSSRSAPACAGWRRRGAVCSAACAAR